VIAVQTVEAIDKATPEQMAFMTKKIFATEDPAHPGVKAFNTVFAQVLTEGPQLAGTPVQVFYAGDDAGAKDAVKALIQSLGFIPIDAGGLKNARYLEPLAGLNIYFGYGAGRGTAIAPAWVGLG